jgi:hypothetical protein
LFGRLFLGPAYPLEPSPPFLCSDKQL